MDESWIVRVLREPITLGYAAFLFLIGAIVRAWPHVMGKLNEGRRDRANGNLSTVQMLIEENERLSTRVRERENEVEQWRVRCLEAEASAMKKQAIIDAKGEINQAAAVASAEARQDALDRVRKEKRGG